MEREKLNELLYQSLETERGGVEVYEAALRCAVNEDLKEEWGKYLDQTKHHVELITGVLEAFQLEPDRRTPGAEIAAARLDDGRAAPRVREETDGQGVAPRGPSAQRRESKVPRTG